MIRRHIRRAATFIERTRHAYDLWSRPGFSWSHAWQIAGTWL